MPKVRYFYEKGLEILLVSDEDKQWYLPKGDTTEELTKESKIIMLDPVENDEGEMIHGMAIEGDWHDIPSIRALIRKDLDFVKHKIKQIRPEVEGGSYIAIKEAFKKVLPQEYKMLKELSLRFKIKPDKNRFWLSLRLLIINIQ